MSSTVITIDDLEKIANEKLTQNAWEYFSSGADDEQTLDENINAFKKLRLRPRLLRGIEKINTEIELLGYKLKTPICIAPTAMHRMANDVGEIGTAKAAAAFGTCMGVSTLSTTSYENVAKAAPDVFYMMQLYIYKNRELSHKLIKRAEQAGFKAIALTIDTPILGRRIANERHKFALPSHLQLANFEGIPEITNVKSDQGSGLAAYSTKIFKNNLSWDDVDWLRSITNLPILLKGILTHEDAKEALKHDVQGIIVSNHGGRQLDGVPSTIEALPEIVDAVNGKLEVYLDGGIRKGTDVFKALALGAKAVFIGRPVLWGLAYDGENGVKKAMQILQDEFERAMFLAGCSSIEEITKDMVTHESTYWRNATPKL